jgi:outer membrane lipopolysaccharide assembly protein LptE/RlpB
MIKAIILSLFLFLSGCSYSFKGGSVPAHLKTVYVAPVIDKSNYGNPTYITDLSNKIIDEIRSDNSLKIVEIGGDSRLEVTITSINERTTSVSANELEQDRKVVVACKVSFTDKINNKVILEKSFSKDRFFDVNQVPDSRDEAIGEIIGELSEEIIFAIVSGW